MAIEMSGASQASGRIRLTDSAAQSFSPRDLLNGGCFPIEEFVSPTFGIRDTCYEFRIQLRSIIGCDDNRFCPTVLAFLERDFAFSKYRNTGLIRR
ncbi:hypothetical protein RZ517_06815 [Roseovarius sp. S88]|uniref:Uncharacterized protein n=1 Tax=Roseovarius phycicola TaxID=3080976 RepID=A0ABZ2HIT6_9RHOB